MKKSMWVYIAGLAVLAAACGFGSWLISGGLFDLAAGR